MATKLRVPLPRKMFGSWISLRIDLGARLLQLTYIYRFSTVDAEISPHTSLLSLDLFTGVVVRHLGLRYHHTHGCSLDMDLFWIQMATVSESAHANCLTNLCAQSEDNKKFRSGVGFSLSLLLSYSPSLAVVQQGSLSELVGGIS